jgi:hypothetical protein
MTCERPLAILPPHLNRVKKVLRSRSVSRRLPDGSPRLIETPQDPRTGATASPFKVLVVGKGDPLLPRFASDITAVTKTRRHDRLDGTTKGDRWTDVIFYYPRPWPR